MLSDTQTAIALALVFGLIDDEHKEAAAARLERRVQFAKFCVATRFAGTAIILHAFSQAGKRQLAYRMLLEKKCPSWMYPITIGATTMWER